MSNFLLLAAWVCLIPAVTGLAAWIVWDDDQRPGDGR